VIEIWTALTSVVAVLCAGLIGMALTRVPRSGVRAPLYGLIAAGVVWLIGSLIAGCATTGSVGRSVGLAVLYTGAIALPSLRFLVSIRWAQQADPGLPLHARIFIRAPLLWSAVLWLVMITNPAHTAFWTASGSGDLTHGPFWFALVVPAYLLVLATLGLEACVMGRATRSDVRRQSAYLIAASFVTLVGGLVYAGGLLASDPGSTVLAVSGALVTLGIARDGLFGVMPAALPAIADQHPDGLVVTGPDGHMRFANARARELLAPIGLRPDVPFALLLRDARLHPETPLDLERASEQTWWNALAGLHGVPFRLDGERPRWLHMSASALRGRRGRIRGYWLRITERIEEPETRLKIA
jgi:PAS domain-containing protein